MSEVDFDRVIELIVELRALGPDQRAARLEALGADDPELRKEVESLLDHGDSGDFLARPALGSASGLADVPGTPDEASLPESIGRYRILGLLGAGGMGAVYHAVQDHPHREVALKLIRRGASSRNVRQRFRREAEILGLLQHAAIAQVYDAGTVDFGEGGQPYLVMELVRGRSLTAYAKRAGLERRARLELFALICDAVEHAHRKGVIHRDLKPDNILVQDDGAPKILDFGIARVTDCDIQVTTLHTDVGQLIGTVPYMSPEQVSGDAADLDTRTDVYALGVVLFELLSGRLPHDLAHCSIPEAARIIRDQDPTRLSSISTTFRGDVDTIVAKALAKEPDRRYPSAAALAADIRRHLADRPIVARPTSTFYQLRKFVRRNRGLSAGVAAAVLFLIGGAAVSTSLYVKAEQRRRAATWQSYLANIAAAGAALEVHNYGEARRRLASALPEYRGWEWQHWNIAQDPSLRRVDNGAPILSLVVSADGRRVVAVVAGSGENGHWTPAGTNKVWDIPAWELVDELAPDASIDTSVAISADGEQVISAGTILWQPGSGLEPTERPLALEGRWTRAYSRGLEPFPVATSPDRRWTVSASGGATARIWDAERKTTVCVLEAGAPIMAVAYSPDGSTVATGDADGQVVVWDAHRGERMVTLDEHDRQVNALAFHPDGERLVSGSQDNTIRVWDTGAGRLLSVFGGHEDRVNTLAVHPNGRWIVSGGNDTALRVWDIDTGSASSAIRAHAGAISEVAFSPDGTRVVSSGARALQIRDAVTGDPVASIATATGSLVVLGDTIVTGSAQDRSFSEAGGLCVWSLETGAKLATYPIVADSLFAHPDGTSVIVTSHEGTQTMIDLSAGTYRPLGCEGGRYAVAISRDGRFLLGSGRWSDGRLHLCDLVSSNTQMLEGHRLGIRDIALHPDGRRVVTASDDMTLCIWDLAARRCVSVLHGHNDRVTSVAVSPDGRRIASGSDDQSVRIWDFERGDLLASLGGHVAAVTSVGFSPDGRRLVSGDAAGTIRIWETDIDSARPMWQAAAVRRPLRSLVDALFDSGLAADAVIARLREDTSLEPAQRALAVRLAEARGTRALPMRPGEGGGDSWKIARTRGHDRATYEQALGWIEAAIAARPQERTFWNTLGILRYRLGRYAEALQALAEAERLNARAPAPFHVAHYRVWQAACHYFLGDTRRARALLAEARAADLENKDLDAFIIEASSIIEAGDAVQP